MALKIRVIYENGVLRPLEPVDLLEGQEASISIETMTADEAALRAALGDSVRWRDPTDDRDAWVEDLAHEIEDAFKGLGPLSEIIIEERNEGW